MKKSILLIASILLTAKSFASVESRINKPNLIQIPKKEVFSINLINSKFQAKEIGKKKKLALHSPVIFYIPTECGIYTVVTISEPVSFLEKIFFTVYVWNMAQDDCASKSPSRNHSIE